MTRRLWRYARNVWWYFVVSLASVTLWTLAPWGDAERLAALVALDAVLWIVVSALRQYLHA